MILEDISVCVQIRGFGGCAVGVMGTKRGFCDNVVRLVLGFLLEKQKRDV